MTSNRGEAHHSPALARQPGANAPSPGAGLGPLAEYRRTVRRLLIASVLAAFAIGFALGVLFTVLEVAR